MEHAELAEKVIGCAYPVYNKAGFGFLESVYEKCRMIELRKAGLRAKSVRRGVKAHEIQVVNDLVTTGKPVGLILNFGESKVELKRKVKTLPEG